MTKGQNYSLQILSAKHCGLNVSFSKVAEQYLQTNTIQPPLIGAFITEAQRCVLWINKNNLNNKALEYVNSLKNQYPFIN